VLEGDPHLRPSHDVRITVRLRATEIGSYQDTLEIRFSRVSNNQLFCVTRTVKAVVGDAAAYALLQPTAPYVPRRRSNRREIGDVVDGIPPPKLLAIAWRFRLGRYEIPKTFRPTFSLPPNRPETGEEDIVPSEIRSLFRKSLRLSNHAQRLSMLLWIEEVSLEYVDHLPR
jgi:helicase MOV-10